MPSRAFLVLLLLLSPGLARAAAPPDLPPPNLDRLSNEERDQRLDAVRSGVNVLTPDDVRRLIGEPSHVCRQILYHRCIEQWIYDGNSPFRDYRLEFDCPRGLEPRLQSVQSPRSPGG